jgi:hypothetical protein
VQAGLAPGAFSGAVELDVLKRYVQKLNESPVAKLSAPRPTN